MRHTTKGKPPTNRRILIVDDFLPWLRHVQVMLESEIGLNTVAAATDGLEAVQKAQHLRPDLVLMDISLPVINGLEATSQIRLLSPGSKILIVSQECSPEVVNEAFGLGAHGYLWKSDVEDELLLAVDLVLQGRRFISSRLRSYVLPQLPSQEGGASRVHELAYYRDDASLVFGFSRFVEAALKVGNPAIVIATETHRDSILQRLQGRGWDISAATQDGLYISLDANDTLSTFMVNDWPDSTRFSKIAVELLTEAAKAAKGKHRRVAACGECAPVLWTQGKAEAAIQLERLWDAIARSHEVNILCGYSFTGLLHDGNSQMFERLRAEHSVAHSV